MMFQNSVLVGGGFALPLRVYIEDTDAGGIVFYGNYLKYYERARTEFVRASGFALRAGLDENISFVVRSVSVQYHRPALLDDILLVTVELQKLGAATMVFSQRVYRHPKGGLDSSCQLSAIDLSAGSLEILSSAEVKVACLALNTMKPCKLPEKLKKSLLPH